MTPTGQISNSWEFDRFCQERSALFTRIAKLKLLMTVLPPPGESLSEILVTLFEHLDLALPEASNPEPHVDVSR